MAMALSTCALLALLGAAAGHPDNQEVDAETGRRLTFSNGLNHIWGGLERCSAHLSDGPADADVEVRLGGLPPSTAGQDVHLQWWSARKSPTSYKPLATPVNCSVHQSLRSAYPAFWEPDFNGGNAKVSATGEATIRVRAPSTYFMWRYIAIPHVHLRICSGSDNIEMAVDAVMMNGPDVWISSARCRSALHVLSASAYAGRRDALPSRNDAAPEPIAVIVGAYGSNADAGGRKTLPEGTTTKPYGTTTEFLAATTTAPPTTTMQASGIPGVLIQAARDALDLDALEFSPVYNCLLEQKFYDHFSGGCASECPASAALKHGQCVREETPEPEARLQTSWQLSINCGEPCWHNKKNVTLHNVRLSFAGHLDIPFQEIEISVGFATSTSRRLSDLKTAYLTVKVASNRITNAEANLLMGTYAQDPASISALLGLDVQAVTPGSPSSRQVDTAKMDQKSDPYAPAYTALENVHGPPHSLVGLLPTEAIIGIAAGVIFLAMSFTVFVWRRQRQSRAAAQAQQAKRIEEKVAEVEANTVPEPFKGGNL